MIRLEHIGKSYFLEWAEYPIIRDVNLTIDNGEFVAIVGPSGSGKSTLMNIIGLLDRPSSGNYFLDGKNMSQIKDHEQAYIRGRRIGFVFQNYALIPRLTALAQVMLPLSYHGVPKSEARMRAISALEQVWLKNHLAKKPEQISGGQKQRVAIARAMVTNPSILLADEPTGALDTQTGNDVINIFRALNNEKGTTIIMITHSDEIAANSNRIIHIRDGIVTG